MGKAMWANRFRKKNALEGSVSPVNARPSGSENTGTRSSSFAPSTARTHAWVSHTMTYPVQPDRRMRKTSARPLIQARTRGPQLRPWANMRAACTAAATSTASDA